MRGSGHGATGGGTRRAACGHGECRVWCDGRISEPGVCVRGRRHACVRSAPIFGARGCIYGMGMDMGMDMWNMLAAILSSHAVAHTPTRMPSRTELGDGLGELEDVLVKRLVVACGVGAKERGE